jgi:hypothetical protein
VELRRHPLDGERRHIVRECVQCGCIQHGCNVEPLT